MKFAAIDIGSNAVRLYVARPLHLDQVDTDFKSVEFTRLPLRLGDDVFRNQNISDKKVALLTKAMQAFALLMEIYNVDVYRACATSAMRDAKNAAKIAKQIQKTTGIKIEIISGLQESKLIQRAVLEWVPYNHNFLHIDVGGGSTEIALIKNGKIKEFESFNIGTVRMREKKIKPSEVERMRSWLRSLDMSKTENIKAVGTGGNIVKLHDLSGCKGNDSLNVLHLKSTNLYIESLSHHDRVYELKLNPDRAEVIAHAGNIFIEIMEIAGIHDIYAPNIGLKDGIIRDLWKTHLRNK